MQPPSPRRRKPFDVTRLDPRVLDYYGVRMLRVAADVVRAQKLEAAAVVHAVRMAQAVSNDH